MTSTRSSKYIHGTSEKEQGRLSILNRLINESSLREMKPGAGDLVLDVGSGLGQFTRQIARAVGTSGRVIGIERDREQIETCRRLSAEAGEADLFEIREGDASSFPLKEDEWGIFDIVHARFLLEHITDPQAVVNNMSKAVRAGGRVILEDDDHDLLRLWPEPSGVAMLWKAYYESFRTLGNDPAIGRKLPSLLNTSGLLPVRITWVYFGACAGEEVFPLYVENLIGIINGAREQILEAEAITNPAIDEAIAGIRKWQKLSDASFWYARAWAEGTRPKG